MKIAIIGGGISGLSLAWYLLKKDSSLDVSVYEGMKRPGGKIFTDSFSGYLIESGVNGFLDNRPMTIELARELGLSPLRSNDSARRRFIYTGGRLRKLPESPISFIKSDLMTLKGKTRLALEYFTPKTVVEDESLSEFAARRLGREAYEKLIEPMALGIYAGDGEKLSLRSCFPKIYNLESIYGGLIKGMLKMKKTSAGPGGVLTSFYSGMQVIVEALTDNLKGKINIAHNAVSIEKNGDVGYRVNFDNNISINPDVLVMATPAHNAAKIFNGFDSNISAELNKIPYPYLVVVATAFHKDNIRSNINGFGYLIPTKEGRKILGSLWDSSIFPDRAPKDSILIRSMLGGAKSGEDFAHLNDKEIKDLVLNELSDIIGIKGEPDILKIYRHEKAMPQYNIGHIGILERLNSIVSNYKGLYLHGNAYKGIGVNDCIENSFNLAERIINQQ
ncbi:MAG: protoporphyrinogen oxidase [Nitrospirae bacterium]|nr:protoporphyrinogen oxidase [Nitrospirota bacterium]MBF0541969.1 protoporphyrinogen oxidase [Nitrospirota bacterium]